METKKCSRCGEVKALMDFGNCRSNSSGKHYECKKCHAIETKNWRAKNKNKTQEYSRDWLLKNKNKSREAKRLNEEKNRNCLSDRYVSSKLGLSIHDCSPELLELKREQLRIKRLIKQLKKEIQND